MGGLQGCGYGRSVGMVGCGYGRVQGCGYGRGVGRVQSVGAAGVQGCE